jgi:ATP-binding cassette subfamily C protein
LARALYGDPFLLLLDEPNSNLDAEGEKAVSRAIEGVKARGGIVVVVAHRPSALVGVDQVAVLQNGQLAAFGPKDEILRAKPVNEARIAQGEDAKKLAAGSTPA